MGKEDKYDIKIVSIMPKGQERLYEMLKEQMLGQNINKNKGVKIMKLYNIIACWWEEYHLICSFKNKEDAENYLAFCNMNSKSGNDDIIKLPDGSPYMDEYGSKDLKYNKFGFEIAETILY